MLQKETDAKGCRFMRIVGGRLSGRRFAAPGGRGTRPTPDRVREALASALESRGAFEDACVLDLFAGTGALSFEALSRGPVGSWMETPAALFGMAEQQLNRAQVSPRFEQMRRVRVPSIPDAE